MVAPIFVVLRVILVYQFTKFIWSIWIFASNSLSITLYNLLNVFQNSKRVHCFRHNRQYLHTTIAEDCGPKKSRTPWRFFLFRHLIHKPLFFELFAIILSFISFATSSALVRTKFFDAISAVIWASLSYVILLMMRILFSFINAEQVKYIESSPIFRTENIWCIAPVKMTVVPVMLEFLRVKFGTEFDFLLASRLLLTYHQLLFSAYFCFSHTSSYQQLEMQANL